jgi:DNA-binding CsgD family transcriptional regulator
MPGATPAPPHPLPAFDTLTARQRQICDLILSGKTNREIAAGLDITVQAVKNHATAIYAKVGITDPRHGRAGQARPALAQRWLDEARIKARNGGYATGYRHGYVDGLEHGRKEGRKAGRQEALTEIGERCSVCPVR